MSCQIGYGFLMGYSSGYCVKRASKLVAFTVGAAFIFVQTLAYNGYVQVNHEKLEKEVTVRQIYYTTFITLYVHRKLFDRSLAYISCYCFTKPLYMKYNIL